MIITNKHFGKIEKKPLQTNIAVNGLYDTKLCGSNTISVIQIIHCNVGLKCFFIYLFFVLIVSFCLHLYFTRQCRKAFTMWWDI